MSMKTLGITKYMTKKEIDAMDKEGESYPTITYEIMEALLLKHGVNANKRRDKAIQKKVDKYLSNR